MIKKPARAEPHRVIAPSNGAIYHGDCVAGMSRLQPGCAQLVFADPPFNIDYEYDVYDDKKTFQEYKDWSRDWVAKVARVIHPSGSFWLAIGPAMAADLDVMIRQEFGFHRRNWIIWMYTFGQNQPKNFCLSNTHLLYYTANRTKFTFNADQVRVPSARQMIYNDNRANPEGRTPDSTWIIRPQDLPDGFGPELNTWHCPRINGTFKSRAGTPNQMPEQVLGRIIRACSNPGDVVLDPFVGSGTTPCVAKKLGRQWIGYELSDDYCKRAQARVDMAKEGDPLDTPDIQGG
jgi:site-specific DNA-methyltransferase (adenine-specific)